MSPLHLRTPAAPVARGLAAALALGLLLTAPAMAQQTSPRPAEPATRAETPAGEPSAVNEFALRVEELKRSLEGFNTQIDGRAKQIGELIDPAKVKQEVENLRAIVAGALAAVSDDSAVGTVGARAIQHARAKVQQFERETRFERQERDFLLGEWRRIAEDTERASDDLDKARRELVQLLTVLQRREDFIDELLQVQRAREAVEVIRQLSRDIEGASQSLRGLIRAIRPPGV